MRFTIYRLTILVNFALLFYLAIGFAETTDAAKTDINNDISEKITEKGKSIDAISSSIEKSTDGMEDEIENAGKAIDSPEAEKRIEIAGESIDTLSDKMDKEIEEKGREIEDSVKTQDGDDEDDKAVSKENNAEKHQSLRQKPLPKTFIRNNGGFEKQAILQQKLEDAIEIQAQRVEDIGKAIEKKRRNSIEHVKKRSKKLNEKTSGKSKNDKNNEQKKKETKRKNKNFLLNRFKNKINKGKLVNKNATKRRVIVPVKRKKLEKLMLYYYVTEKMKSGDLPVHNLEKFFKKLDDYSHGSTNEDKKQTEATPDLGSLVKMLGGSAKKDSGVKTREKETANSEMPNLSSFIDKIKKISENESGNEAKDDENEDTKKPDLESFIRVLDKKLKSNDADRDDDDDKKAPKKADLKSSVGDESTATTNVGNNAMGTSSDEAGDNAELKDMDDQKVIAKAEKANSVADMTKQQVQRMLKSIAEINATLLDHGKQKRRHKKIKKKNKGCKDDNCIGRDIISLLDKALHEVQKEKADSNKPKTIEKSNNQESKMTGEARSKSDPYAGIGFAATQDEPKTIESNEMTSQGNRAVQAESRHIESHGSDITGTDEPVRNRMLHGHHHNHHEDDDGDDDDEDDDDEDDDHHESHVVHGYHIPLPMHHELNHGDQHVHHIEHELMPYEHHGYHGHHLPVQMGEHHVHEDLGYSPPLNVDTAPMHHYPDRHIHDHLDIDSMLRGHPYPHHHHTPEVSLEGPISLAPVYDDMHHMLNGPGIHDQTDVHYEVEMHAHPDHHGFGHHGYGHHGYDHHGDDHHGDDHHGDDSYDEDHHDEDIHHYAGFRHEHGYDHDDHDQGDHHDDDYHDDYNHGDDHEHGENGEKKHVITPANKKSGWKSFKSHVVVNKSTKKPKRSTRDEEEDDDDNQNDDTVENVPRNGYGVSRLSYLTEQNGETMEHEIGDKIHDVEDVGRSIEDAVQHGVDRVTELSNKEVEAPDYDNEGHMEPNIHREDIQDDDD